MDGASFFQQEGQPHVALFSFVKNLAICIPPVSKSALVFRSCIMGYGGNLINKWKLQQNILSDVLQATFNRDHIVITTVILNIFWEQKVTVNLLVTRLARLWQA